MSASFIVKAAGFPFPFSSVAHPVIVAVFISAAVIEALVIIVPLKYPLPAKRFPKTSTLKGDC